MARLLFVHGVATSEADPVAALWSRELRAAGLPNEGVDGRWPSTGSFARDVVSFVDPNFARDADEAVAHAIDDFVRGGSGVVVAHSMGTVLALNAERLLRTGVPIVCLASPLSNPGIRSALMKLGYGRAPPSPCIHLWNDDDPIPGGKLADQPRYFQATRIAVPDNEAASFASEHDVRPYLRHAHVVNAIRLCWERDD